MLIDELNNIIFIDDEEESVSKAISYFRKHGKWVTFLSPLDIFPLKRAQCICLDISVLKGDTNPINAVNCLRSLVDKDGEVYGPYLLIIWTENIYLVESVKKLIKERVKNKPLAITPMDKTELNYIEGNEEKFSEMIKRTIDNVVESEEIERIFRWKNCCEKAIDDTLVDILNISRNENSDYYDLKKVLYGLSTGTSMLNMYGGAFENLNSILFDNIDSSLIIDKKTKIAKEKQVSEDINLECNYHIICQSIKEDSDHSNEIGNLYYKVSTKVVIPDDMIGSNKIKKTLIDKGIVSLKNIGYIDITPPCTFAKEPNKALLVKTYVFCFKKADNFTANKFSKNIKGLRDNYIKVGLFKHKEEYCAIIVDGFDVITMKRDDLDDMKVLYKIREVVLTNIRQQVANFLSRPGDNVINIFE